LKVVATVASLPRQSARNRLKPARGFHFPSMF
jgi:hypothetical protein